MMRLDAGPAHAVVDPEAGGRIASLTVHGFELLVTQSQAAAALGHPPGPYGWGLFPMAPWAGRIARGKFTFAGRPYQLPVNFGPHAIHGTLADRPAGGSEQVAAAEAIVTWTLGPPWPFAGWAAQTVVLAADGLSLTLEIRADEAMPVTCGWHPWWSRQIGSAEPVELEFQPEAMYQLDEEGIPTGELIPPPAGPWDDCFPMPSTPIRLRWPGALEVTLESGCPEVVVYDKPPYAVCVEPETGPPDAVNLGIHCQVLEPGDLMTTTARWTWR
jgi:aldose 1-epimerase